MHGMKDFHTVRIDDVLLYAVAIVLKSGGPLTDVFNRIIGGSTELLPPVRDMIYEDRLGLSATIYNQRVLLGNRNLLTHHNIEVPLKSEEDKVKRNGRKILYIAIDSQVAAMFVFNYAEDASLKDSINEMADNGFSLVVRTDDPNVTDELIAARFGIAQKDIKMTLSHGARIFSAYRDSVVDSAPQRSCTTAPPDLTSRASRRAAGSQTSLRAGQCSPLSCRRSWRRVRYSASR